MTNEIFNKFMKIREEWTIKCLFSHVQSLRKEKERQNKKVNVCLWGRE